MSSPSEIAECGWVEARLEAYVDDDVVDASEALRLRNHLEACASCRGSHELALRVRDGLRTLPSWDAPERVLRRALEAGREEENSGRRARTAVWWLAAAALTLALVLPWVARRDDPSVALGGAPRVDPVAVERATIEARFALAQVSRAGLRAALEIRDGMLRDRPVGTALRETGAPLPGENGREGRPEEVDDNDET